MATKHQMNKDAAIYLAVDALDFKPGDWHQENIIRHLERQIEMARGHLVKAIAGTDVVVPEGPQVYAKIRPGTRYEDQCSGQWFPVQFVPSRDGYHWKGGPGGQYRHSDLYLSVVKDDEHQAIPTFHVTEREQITDLTLELYAQRADRGELNPEWFSKYSGDLIKQLRHIAKRAEKTYDQGDE